MRRYVVCYQLGIRTLYSMKRGRITAKHQSPAMLEDLIKVRLIGASNEQHFGMLSSVVRSVVVRSASVVLWHQITHAAQHPQGRR